MSNGIYNIKKNKSTGYFLKYEPEITNYSNDKDTAKKTPGGLRRHVTQEDLKELKQVKSSMGNKCKVIVEIGVDRGGLFTDYFLSSKRKDEIYVGIDINDKTYLEDKENNIFILQADSKDQEKVRKFLSSIGVEQIDFFYIDGHHSVSFALNDWKYVDLLSDDGVVGLHDCHHHPGPVVLFDAVDETVFDKKKYGSFNTWGVALFSRKPNGPKLP